MTSEQSVAVQERVLLKLMAEPMPADVPLRAMEIAYELGVEDGAR